MNSLAIHQEVDSNVPYRAAPCREGSCFGCVHYREGRMKLHLTSLYEKEIRHVALPIVKARYLHGISWRRGEHEGPRTITRLRDDGGVV